MRYDGNIQLIEVPIMKHVDEEYDRCAHRWDTFHAHEHEFIRCKFNRVVFSNSRLEDVVFEDTVFNDSALDFTRFERVKFNRCQFIETDLYTSYFESCTFKDCTFERSKIKSSEFPETLFEKCRLTGCDLKCSNFTSAVCHWTLTDCKHSYVNGDGQYFVSKSDTWHLCLDRVNETLAIGCTQRPLFKWREEAHLYVHKFKTESDFEQWVRDVEDWIVSHN